jgi:hypothetical protein
MVQPHAGVPKMDEKPRLITGVISRSFSGQALNTTHKNTRTPETPRAKGIGFNNISFQNPAAPDLAITNKYSIATSLLHRGSGLEFRPL